MRPIACPETSARNYHYSLLNNAEQGSLHLLRGGSLKSRIVMTINQQPCLPIHLAQLLLGLCLYHGQVTNVRL